MRKTLPVQVYRELDAKERVLLPHQALLDDREPDPEIRRTTPPNQYADANHYLRMANGIIGIVTPWALSLCQTGELLRAISVLHLMTSLARNHGAPITTGLDGATVARLQRDLDELMPRLAVVERVLADVEREFGSEDVTPIEVRQFLRGTHADIVAVLEMVPGLKEPPTTPGPELLRTLSTAVRER